MKVADIILFESSISRIYQFWVNSKDDPNYRFALLTSWRDEDIDKAKKAHDQAKLDTALNIQWTRFRAFKKEIQSLGLGFVQLLGHGQEENKVTGRMTNVSDEPSLFIPRITFEQTQQEAQKWDQDTFIYVGPETDGQAILFNKNGSRNMNLGPFRPIKIGEYYSELRHKPFTFHD